MGNRGISNLLDLMYGICGMLGGFLFIAHEIFKIDLAKHRADHYAIIIFFGLTGLVSILVFLLWPKNKRFPFLTGPMMLIASIIAFLSLYFR